jgi:hypothetical protein
VLATTAGQNPPQGWLDNRSAETIPLAALKPLPTGPSKRSTNTPRTNDAPLSDASVSEGTQYSGPATAKVPERFHNGRQRRRPPPPKSHEFAGLITPGVPSISPLQPGDRPRPDSSVFGYEPRYGGQVALETFDEYFADGTTVTLPIPTLASVANYSRLIIPDTAPSVTQASTAGGTSPQLPPPALPDVRPNELP